MVPLQSKSTISWDRNMLQHPKCSTSTQRVYTVKHAVAYYSQHCRQPNASSMTNTIMPLNQTCSMMICFNNHGCGFTFQAVPHPHGHKSFQLISSSAVLLTQAGQSANLIHILLHSACYFRKRHVAVRDTQHAYTAVASSQCGIGVAYCKQNNSSIATSTLHHSVFTGYPSCCYCHCLCFCQCLLLTALLFSQTGNSMGKWRNSQPFASHRQTAQLASGEQQNLMRV